MKTLSILAIFLISICSCKESSKHNTQQLCQSWRPITDKSFTLYVTCGDQVKSYRCKDYVFMTGSNIITAITEDNKQISSNNWYLIFD